MVPGKLQGGEMQLRGICPRLASGCQPVQGRVQALACVTAHSPAVHCMQGGISRSHVRLPWPITQRPLQHLQTCAGPGGLSGPGKAAEGAPAAARPQCSAASRGCPAAPAHGCAACSLRPAALSASQSTVRHLCMHHLQSNGLQTWASIRNDSCSNSIHSAPTACNLSCRVKAEGFCRANPVLQQPVPHEPAAASCQGADTWVPVCLVSSAFSAASVRLSAWLRSCSWLPRSADFAADESLLASASLSCSLTRSRCTSARNQRQSAGRRRQGCVRPGCAWHLQSSAAL